MGQLDKIKKQNLSEQVYSIIRDSLMDGKYQPGDRLRIGTLAEELGVSITPVREAIFRLVSDHALVMQAATSVHVPVLDRESLDEIQLIRRLLEGEAAAKAATRITPRQLNKLAALQDRFNDAIARDANKASVLNRRFHLMLVTMTATPIMLGTVENMWTLIGPRIHTIHTRIPSPEFASGKHPHFDILAALKIGDAAKAKAAIQSDIDLQTKLILHVDAEDG